MADVEVFDSIDELKDWLIIFDTTTCTTIIACNHEGDEPC